MITRATQAALLLVSAAACTAAPSRPAGGTERPFTVTEVGRFDKPWAMDFLPGSGARMTAMALITEKGGALWLVVTASGARQAVTGVPAAHVAGQGGLGEVVAHPDFAGNQRVYLSFAEAGAGGTSGAALGYGRLILGDGKPRLDGFKVIWRQTPKVEGNGHFGHRIAFAPDGNLFLTSGEREKKDPAQDPASDLGKFLRLTAEGQPAQGNPWADRGGRAASYWTMGHRNALGIAFAPDGRLWSSEMGPKGGDELNLIVAGKNYGWPEVSYGSHYDGRAIPDDHRGKGFEEPKEWWNSVSPGGLVIYSGDLFKGWQGDALIPALSGKALLRVDIDADKARKADQWPMGARIRSVDQGPRGEIYLLEDGDGGRLLKLEPTP